MLNNISLNPYMVDKKFLISPDSGVEVEVGFKHIHVLCIVSNGSYEGFWRGFKSVSGILMGVLLVLVFTLVLTRHKICTGPGGVHTPTWHTAKLVLIKE